jgi:hypothetical protein
MIVFPILVGLAIYWSKKPEFHRRLLLLVTCALLDAPFNRIGHIIDHSLGFLCADAVILLGVARDLLVDRRVHKVYLVGLPLMMIFHAWLIYL